jgi:hypothetical protein
VAGKRSSTAAKRCHPTLPSKTSREARRGKNDVWWVVAMTNYDNDNDNDDDSKARGSNMECITTAVCSGKCQAWPLMDHIERLLEEACPNHEYPIKHKLNDYGMMKNFMTSGSLTQDQEPEEDPGGSRVM